MPESTVFNNRTVQKLQVEDRVDLQDFPPAGLYRVVGVQSSGNTFFVDLQAETVETRRRLILQRGFRLRVLAEDKDKGDGGGKAAKAVCPPAAADVPPLPCPAPAARPRASLFPC